MIVEDYGLNQYLEVPFSIDKDALVILGQETEVQQKLTYEAMKSSVLSVEKAKDHVMFTGTVLIPGEPDCDAENGEDPLTAQKVASIAHSFWDYQIVDKNHEYLTTGEEIGKPVESWLLEEPKVMKNVYGVDREYPEGTWIAKSKITDPDMMEKALKGELAYSVTALSKAAAEELKVSGKSRVLIKDLTDPVGFTLSLVKNPCVDNSCSAKSAAAMKAGKVISNQNKSVLEKARDLINGLLETANNDVNGGNNMSGENKSEKSEETEFVTKSELKETEDRILEAIKGKEEDPKKSEKSEEKDEEKKSEKSEEKKGPGSKAMKNHDDGKDQPAFKSVESYMGRNHRGRPVKQVKE